MTTYTVANMRFIKASGKTAERNPDRIGTVVGKFYTDKGVELSITSKAIDRSDALDPETVIDLVNGTLVLPSGERGRKPSVSMTQDAINSLLDAVRNPEPVNQPKAAAAK